MRRHLSSIWLWLYDVSVSIIVLKERSYAQQNTMSSRKLFNELFHPAKKKKLWSFISPTFCWVWKTLLQDFTDSFIAKLLWKPPALMMKWMDGTPLARRVKWVVRFINATSQGANNSGVQNYWHSCVMSLTLQRLNAPPLMLSTL